jgi:hypothetical protein
LSSILILECKLKNSKLIQLLKTFSSSEFTEFGKFVKSPFYNESKKMILLYDFFKKYFPDFNSINFTKENAFKNVYGNAVYQDKKLRDRFTDMIKLAEKYLAILGMRASVCDEKLFVLHQHRQRQLPSHFYKKYNEIKLTLDKSKIKDVPSLYDYYAVESIKEGMIESFTPVGKRKHSNENLEYQMECFIKYFTTRMLLYYNIMNNWSLQFNYKFDYKLYESLMQYTAEKSYNDPPILRAAYLMLKMRDDKDNEQYYFELKKIFIKSIESFSAFDKTMISAALYNEAQRRYMEGNEEFSAERFKMIKLQLKYKTFFMMNDSISREQYLNAVIIPISLGKLQWAKKFAQEYKNRLPPHTREEALAYTAAYIKYSQKDYGKSLEELLKIKGGDYIYYLKIKTLQSRIYFEQNEYEKLLSMIDSFKHYVKSNPAIPEETIKRYINFNSVLHKLTMLVIKYDEYKITKLIKDINRFSYNEVTTNKSWLIEKANELKDSHSR